LDQVEVIVLSLNDVRAVVKLRKSATVAGIAKP
jgi:hypothetical protein